MDYGAKFPEATIRGTHVRKLASSIVDQEYEIHVSLPEGYGDSDRNYPVIYFLDSDLMFGIATQMHWLLNFFDEVRRFIIVGIGGYGKKDQEITYGRSRDYTPTKVSKEELGDLADIVPASGGGAEFLDFIRRDLCPFIEDEYRTNPAERCIAGASLGGLFCMYALFHAPEFSSKYIIGSPSLWWDNRVTFDYEEEFSKNHKALPVDIYTSMGALEGGSMVPDWQKMIDILRNRNYDGLRITSDLFDGETHVSVISVAFTRGMRALFPPD